MHAKHAKMVMSHRNYYFVQESSMRCPNCKSKKTKELQKKTGLGYKQFRCHQCDKQFNERTGTPFNFLGEPVNKIV
jgi:transposase-like protein